METQQKKIIEDYISAYNTFDIAGMVQHLHPEVIFENIANEEVTLKTVGCDAFQQQAETATSYFKNRTQRITDWNIQENTISISINYHAILAIDLPNGLKAGDALNLSGQSVFEFQEGQIIRLQDKS